MLLLLLFDEGSIEIHKSVWINRYHLEVGLLIISYEGFTNIYKNILKSRKVKLMFLCIKRYIILPKSIYG